MLVGDSAMTKPHVRNPEFHCHVKVYIIIFITIALSSLAAATASAAATTTSEAAIAASAAAAATAASKAAAASEAAIAAAVVVREVETAAIPEFGVKPRGERRSEGREIYLQSFVQK